MTRQQQWASGALERVCARAGMDESSYRTLCLKMPVLIHQSGLAQAVAFMMSRETMGQQFCADLGSVYGVPGQALEPAKALRRTVFAANDLTTYMSLTRDLIEVTIWFRRFAHSELRAAQ